MQQAHVMQHSSINAALTLKCVILFPFCFKNSSCLGKKKIAFLKENPGGSINAAMLHKMSLLQ